MNVPKFHARLLLPQHWPIWIAVGLLYLTSRLPVPAQWMLGRLLGRLMYYALPQRRRVARINLKLCLPELSEDEKRRLIKKHFQSMGMGALEVGMGWWTPLKRMARYVHFNGIENLQQAIDQGNGVIILSAHFTTLEIGGRLLGETQKDKVAFCAMYRPHENPVVEFLIRRYRQKHLGTLYARNDIRGVIRALKKHHQAVWYAPDQSVPPHRGDFVPFFGVPACTNTASPRLAKVTGAPVVPYVCYRDLQNRRYILDFHPVLENFPTGDDVADMLQVNHVFEEQIRHHTDQYFWMHRRFKWRPDSQPSYYKHS